MNTYRFAIQPISAPAAAQRQYTVKADFFLVNKSSITFYVEDRSKNKTTPVADFSLQDLDYYSVVTDSVTEAVDGLTTLFKAE